MDDEDKIKAWASYAQNAAQPHILPGDVARRIAVALLANSEAEQRERIQELESRAAKAADLIKKAVGMMAPHEAGN